MTHRYTKTISRPKLWYKGTSKTYTVTLAAGKLSTVNGLKYRVNIPIGLVLRDLLQVETTMLKIKKLLKSKKILVNGKVTKNVQYPLTVLDIITFDNKHYRLLVAKRFYLESLIEPLLCSTVTKTTRLKNNVYQINCLNGVNYLENKPVSASLVAVFNLEKNSLAYKTPSELTNFIIIKGAHKGKTGKTSDALVEEGLVKTEQYTVSQTNVLFYD